MQRPDCVKFVSLEYIGEQNKPDNWVQKNYEIVPIEPEWIKDGTANWELIGDNWVSFDELYQHFKRDGQQGSQTNFGKMLNDFSVSKDKKIMFCFLF